MESQTLQNALIIGERVATTRTVLRGHPVLGALLLAALLVVTFSTRELSDRLAAGAASTSDALTQEQARQADELAAVTTRTEEATRTRMDAEARAAAYGAELERLTAGPVPNDSTATWARAAVVTISGAEGFAVAYRGGATYIITALHVLGGARTARVITQQGAIYAAQLVAVSSADAALLRIDALIPILFFRAAPSPGDIVSLVGNGRVEAATVVRVSDTVIEIALPAAHAVDSWLGFSGGPVIAANGFALGIVSSGDGMVAQVVPRSATCDILLCK